MYPRLSVSIAAAIGLSSIGNAFLESENLIEASPSKGSKLSAGDKAHRAYHKTRLYRPNGERECARRRRQAA